MFWIVQSTLGEQLIHVAKGGKCDEIQRLVKEGANKNCRGVVREKSRYLSILHQVWFQSFFIVASCVCYFSWIFIIINLGWLDSTDVGIQLGSYGRCKTID